MNGEVSEFGEQAEGWISVSGRDIGGGINLSKFGISCNFHYFCEEIINRKEIFKMLKDNTEYPRSEESVPEQVEEPVAHYATVSNVDRMASCQYTIEEVKARLHQTEDDAIAGRVMTTAEVIRATDLWM